MNLTNSEKITITEKNIDYLLKQIDLAEQTKDWQLKIGALNLLEQELDKLEKNEIVIKTGYEGKQ